MKTSRVLRYCMTAVLAVLLATTVRVMANQGQNSHGEGHGSDNGDDRKPTIVTVAFGAGLNSVGAANHHVLPRKIEIQAGGVVNFVVAGFHQIFVYKPGVKPSDVLANAPAFPPPVGPPTPEDLYINYGFPINPANPILFYAGINPGGIPPSPPNPPGNPAMPLNSPLFSNTFNRVEPVTFMLPGTYLVICNINPHFRDGMWAWVTVKK